MFAESLDVFLADFGVDCSSASAVAFKGVLDTPDETMSMTGVNVQSTMYALLVKTSTVQAAALASGQSITVAGQAYVIRDLVLQDDGAFTSLTLSR